MNDAGAGDAGFDPTGQQCAYPGDPGPVPPRYSVRGGVEHWQLEPGCIQVTYQPDLDVALVAHLQGAVNAFEAVGCSRLCLEAPSALAVDAADLDADLFGALAALGRRIHFMIDRRALLDAGLAEVYTDGDSGAMLSAFVFLPEASSVPLGIADVLALLGASAGLGSAGSGVDSVMSPEGRDDLSALDQAALCVLYGDDPLCE